ncbi:hypothetical protein DFH29DRAFT_1066282 [Suillus ampliporus]|nr:hypothetical protein DFH29DRAFT_1066282 [Suillus ampliporus]
MSFVTLIHMHFGDVMEATYGMTQEGLFGHSSPVKLSGIKSRGDDDDPLNIPLTSSGPFKLFPMSNAEQNRLALNNLLQQRYGASAATHLRWEGVRDGPDNNPTWTFIAYIDDIEYGRGSGSNKGTAKEIAAGVAFMQLRTQWAHLLF